MEILIDLREQTLSSIASDGVFYSQTETEIKLVAQNGEQGDFNGVSCALLAPDGKTLAHAIASGNKAVINTNTQECVNFVEGASIDSEKIAFLAIGDSDKPLAILPVAMKRNPIANIAPPAELAPTYPTSESLLAILAQMTEQANRAKDALEATEKAQKAVADYVDITFPSKVTDAEKRLTNATTKGVQAVTDKATQSVNSITAHTTTIIGALDTKKTAIATAIDTKAQAVNSALDTKITSANSAIDKKVEQANEAKGDAVKAKDDAVTAKTLAEGFATQASTSAESASKSAQQAEDALDAIGDVGERLDAVDTYGGIVHRRDVMRELQVAKGWSNEYMDTVEIAQVISTELGNIVVLAQKINSYSAILVFSPSGEKIAEKVLQTYSPEADAIYPNIIVETLDGIFVLTGLCRVFKVTETESGATIVEDGTIDLNGVVTSLKPKRFYKFAPVAIGNLVIINGSIVVDMSTKKVVQSLTSIINQTSIPVVAGDASVIVATTVGIARLSVVDGLIDVSQIKTNPSHRYIYCPNSDAIVVVECKRDRETIVSTRRQTGDSFYGSIAISNAISPYFAIDEKGHFVNAAYDGSLIFGTIYGALLSDSEGALQYNATTVPSRGKGINNVWRRILGVDNRGVWIMMGSVDVWSGVHATEPLIRINWEDFQ